MSAENLAKNQDYISVSELSSQLSFVLEREFAEVFFQGEISEIKTAASGHIYFTIKDDKSQLSSVMWKGMRRALTFEPKAGLHVLCRGAPSIYRVSGRLQIVVHYMSPAGEGALQKKFLELKAKLENEGLFAEERKRKLPLLPQTIGIVTSSGGAVIHDIMVKISERMPNQKVFLINVKVQGDGAAQEIEKAIQYYNRKKIVDVIIVARGGGSLEDLWAFNEERTVRAIFASSIPVVSGVGHEVDITLADLAADLRAPTPTAAAEIVVPKRQDLLSALNEYQRRLKDFSRWLQPLVQRADELEYRMQSAYKMQLQNSKVRLRDLQLKVQSLKPAVYLSNLKARFNSVSYRFKNSLIKVCEQEKKKLDLYRLRQDAGIKNVILTANSRLSNFSARLENLNTRKVLARGVSIAEHDGQLIKSSKQLKKHDQFKLILYQGDLQAKVEKIS